MTKFTRTLPAITLGLAFGTAYYAYAALDTTANLKDDSYVTLSGKVGKIIDGDEFMLQTSAGAIKIDTNDEWPGLFDEAAGSLIKTGDRVTVTGRVDDNFFAQKEIEAHALTHQGQNYSVIYQNSGQYGYYPSWQDYDETYTRLSGTVTQLTNDDEFILSYAGGTIQVDISDTAIPDTEQLQVGDRVTVYGKVTDDWFEKREFEATRLMRVDSFPTRG